MYLLEDDVYEETAEIKSGRLEKSPLLKDLSDWFAEEFKVEVLNFRFDTITIAKRNRFRLEIILDNRNDYDKMEPDPFRQNKEHEKTEKRIALRFKDLALKHGLPINKRIKNIFVVFYDFSKEARCEANEKIIKGFRKQVKAKYRIVWDVYEAFEALIVFYYTDRQVEENRNSGISEAIQNQYYEALKPFNEMNYFTRENLEMEFDSKENLDQNFDGNFYYYIH